jgi:hypothetical protein
MYTLNNFSFDSFRTFDRWVKNRVIGQKRLVTSLDVPYEYMRLYRHGHRKLFRQKFPNIKRIGIDTYEPYFTYHKSGVPFQEAKNKTVRDIKEKEGQNVEVDWHYGQGGTLRFYPS